MLLSVNSKRFPNIVKEGCRQTHQTEVLNVTTYNTDLKLKTEK